MDQYKVRPRKTHDGWNLGGDRLSHGSLWFENKSAAVGYAKWNSRVNGCKIEILDQGERIIRTEEFSSGDFLLRD